MMGAVGRALRTIVSGTSGQRAVDATLADWRYERAAASTPLQRFVIHVRSAAALVRTIALAGVAECAQVPKASLMARLAAVTIALVGLTVIRTGLPGDGRFFQVASPLEAWIITAAAMAGQLAIAFPLLVFASEVIGRRNRDTRVMGSLTVLVCAGVLLTLIVLPSALAFGAYERWRFFANAAQPAPSVGAMWLAGASLTVSLMSSAATVVLFLLANGIRRVGGLVGWAVGLGPAVVVVALLLVARLTWMPFDGRTAVMLASPVAIAAALIWSAATLAGIAAARSAPANSLSNG